jgi:hypothetical protein
MVPEDPGGKDGCPDIDYNHERAALSGQDHPNQHGEQNVVPELIEEAPKWPVGAEHRCESRLEKKQTAEEARYIQSLGDNRIAEGYQGSRIDSAVIEEMDADCI